MKNRIWARDIIMQFQNTTILNKISMELKEGEIFGLLGPSGAGKTTLIKILTGQLKQTSGNAELLGVSNLKIPGSVYTKIGMVLDNAGLYERLSCYDNLLLFAQIYEISKDRIPSVLQKVGLEEAKKVPVYKLSKGMRGRLVLARAIMHHPKLLFLDEPTSGLDPTTTAYIHDLIKTEKEQGTTIFLTTHNMEEATKLCDTVALLNQGEIVISGNPMEICRQYNHQNQIKIRLEENQEIILRNDPSSAEILAGYIRKNQIESIHSTEPNLETVFIELTGRKIEDYENEKNSSNFKKTTKRNIKK